MLSKLTYKIVLEYYLDNKKVIFSSEISSDGLATTTISIGDNKVIETTINGRVLSGEVTLNGVTSGYEYVYDKDGITIELNPKNKNISVTESVSLINKLKNSKDFFKVRTDGVLASNNSSDFISIPDQNFIVYKEVSLIDTNNTYI